jgi:hypothetical protein
VDKDELHKCKKKFLIKKAIYTKLDKKVKHHAFLDLLKKKDHLSKKKKKKKIKKQIKG